MTLSEAYSILGVPINTDLKTVQAQFQKLALKYHPDRAGGSEEKMKEINNAMNIIKNPSMADSENNENQNSYNVGYQQRNKTTRTRNNNFEADEFFKEFFNTSSFNTTVVHPKVSPSYNKTFSNNTPSLKSAVIGITESDLKNEELQRTFEKKVPCESEVICSSCKGSRKKVVEVSGGYFGDTSYQVILCPACKGMGKKKNSCYYCTNQLKHSFSCNLKVPIKSVLENIGQEVLCDLSCPKGVIEERITFTLLENPFSFYVKVPLEGLEERLKKNDNISFLFLGLKKTCKLSEMIKGQAFSLIGHTKIYFRIFTT